MHKSQGFTLVEISIVLVIIGLLLGGILKGQEMVMQAKIKNSMADFAGVSAAYYGYEDRYRAIPGDDLNAATRWAGATSGDGNGIVAGTYNNGGAACAAGVCFGERRSAADQRVRWPDRRADGRWRRRRRARRFLRAGDVLGQYPGQGGDRHGHANGRRPAGHGHRARDAADDAEPDDHRRGGRGVRRNGHQHLRRLPLAVSAPSVNR